MIVKHYKCQGNSNNNSNLKTEVIVLLIVLVTVINSQVLHNIHVQTLSFTYLCNLFLYIQC